MSVMMKRTLYDSISCAIARDVDRSGWVSTHNSTAPRDAAKAVSARLVLMFPDSGYAIISSKPAMTSKADASSARVEKDTSHHITAQQSRNRMAQRLYTVGLRLLA